MNPNDLWIGDWLKSKISGKTGQFEGTDSEGRLKVNVDGKIILMKAPNVELTSEPEMPTRIRQKSHEESRQVFASPMIKKSSVIDLHIEVLAPELIGEEALRIRNFQLEACKDFVLTAYDSGIREVKIIHGKGEGKLKTYVQTMLKSDPRVNFISENPDGGSTVVLFKS